MRIQNHRKLKRVSKPSKWLCRRTVQNVQNGAVGIMGVMGAMGLSKQKQASKNLIIPLFSESLDPRNGGEREKL